MSFTSWAAVRGRPRPAPVGCCSRTAVRIASITRCFAFSSLARPVDVQPSTRPAENSAPSSASANGLEQGRSGGRWSRTSDSAGCPNAGSPCRHACAGLGTGALIPAAGRGTGALHTAGATAGTSACAKACWQGRSGGRGAHIPGSAGCPPPRVGSATVDAAAAIAKAAAAPTTWDTASADCDAIAGLGSGAPLTAGAGHGGPAHHWCLHRHAGLHNDLGEGLRRGPHKWSGGANPRLSLLPTAPGLLCHR